MDLKETYRKKLIAGYIFAVIGFIIGINFRIHGIFILSGFFISYFCWSLFWGWQIIYKPVTDFFSKMIVFEDNLSKLFFEYILKRIIIYSIILSIGIIIGACGGALYMQVKLSQIAYNSKLPSKH